MRGCSRPLGFKANPKGLRNRFYAQVESLNAQTHALKTALRDRCGPQGRAWYERLEECTRRRRVGLPVPTGELRARHQKWTDPNRGFGFIQPRRGGADVQVGQRNLRGIKALQKGDTVEFGIRQGNKGPWAYSVTRVG